MHRQLKGAAQSAAPGTSIGSSVKAQTQTRAFRRHALIPKTPGGGRRQRPEEIEDALGPPERQALREIAETADLAIIDGRLVLIAVITDQTVDALAAFEAEAAELEGDDDDHCEAHDDDPTVRRTDGVGLPGDPEDAESDGLGGRYELSAVPDLQR